MKMLASATLLRAHRSALTPAWPWCAAAALITIASCGGGSGNGNPAPPAAAAPSISVQPIDQNVPMGLKATFSVTAAADSAAGQATPTLQYQWLLNGKAIPGATGSSYVTPATMFTDSGSQFTVSVSDAGGSVTSSSASLTVTARAPNPQDLRFGMVDADPTLNGWGSSVGEFTNVTPGTGQTFSGSIGTPLMMGAGDSGAEPSYQIWPAVVPGQSGTFYGLDIGYVSAGYPDFPAVVQPGSVLWSFDDGVSPASPSAVVNSLNLAPTVTQDEWPQGTYALSFIQNPAQTGFDVKVATVDSASLQAAVAQDGASSRVVTALSGNNGQITYLSYGWQGDLTTVYETQVVTAASTDAPAAAAGLAQQGYIITACGMADASTVVFVGTRVAGDTMPRPFTTDAMSKNYMQQGYAVVAVIDNTTATSPLLDLTYLAER